MTKNKELKQKILVALEKRLGKKSNKPFSALDDKRQKVINLLYKKIIESGKLTEKNIDQKIDEVLKTVKEQTSINDKVVFENLKKSFEEVSEKQTDKLVETLKQKPTWHKDFPKEIEFKTNKKQRKEDVSILTTLLSTFFTSLVDFLSKLAKGVFKVRLGPEHYLTPQKVVILDPHTMKAIDLKELGQKPVVYQVGNGGGGSPNVTVLNSLINFEYNYILANTSGATQDIYTYKQGGASGTVVGVITITWTNSTKKVLQSVART